MDKTLMAATVQNNTFTEKRRGGGLAPNAVKKTKILVVDDEETVGIGMSEILKDAGFSAGYVVSGKDAVEQAMRDPVSLVFMDMIMPGMDGLETYRMLKALNPNVRVVIFTGFFKDVDKTIYQGIKEGMIDLYIWKPFYAEEIINAAKKFA